MLLAAVLCSAPTRPTTAGSSSRPKKLIFPAWLPSKASPVSDSLPREGLAPSLEERFLGNSVAAWVDRLRLAGVGAQRVVTNVRELMEDPWVVGHGLSLTREHDELGLVTTCGPAPRLSSTPVRPGIPAPKPGSHAEEILREHGLDADYQRLVEAGIILTDGVSAG